MREHGDFEGAAVLLIHGTRGKAPESCTTREAPQFRRKDKEASGPQQGSRGLIRRRKIFETCEQGDFSKSAD